MTEYQPSLRADSRQRPWYVMETRVGRTPGIQRVDWFCRDVTYTPCGPMLANVRPVGGPVPVDRIKSILLNPLGPMESLTVIYDGPAGSMRAPEPEDY